MSFTIGTKKPKVTMAKRAGLHLPARSIKRQVNDGEFRMRAGEDAAIYLTGQLEFVATAIVGAAADRSSILGEANRKRRGLVTAQGIEALMRSDKSGTFASLLRDCTPFHPHTVCARDDEIVNKAASAPKRQKKSHAAAAAAKAVSSE